MPAEAEPAKDQRYQNDLLLCKKGSVELGKEDAMA
jgi:hypothetical protein